MEKTNALAVSIGILGGIDTYLLATIVPLPVWVTFISWACFFILGGGNDGFVRTVASNAAGIVIASLSLIAITLSTGAPVIAGISVGIGSAAMVQSSRLPKLSAIPAIVWGFASTVAVTQVTGDPITLASVSNPALVTFAAMVLGAVFGYLSEAFGEVLTVQQPSPAKS